MKKKSLLIPFLFALTGAGFSSATVYDPPGPAGTVTPCRLCGLHNLCSGIDDWTDCLTDSGGVNCIGEQTRTVKCGIGDEEG